MPGKYITNFTEQYQELWGWGKNSWGQLGDNTTTPKSSPVQTVAGGTNWKQASNSYNFTAAIKTDGTLWTWGYNASGQLGDNTRTNTLSPIQTIAGGTNWVEVAAGYRYTAAIKTDGTLWLWGYNGSGQLGDNTITDKSSPIQTVAGGNSWKQVAVSGYHTAAIKTDGTLWLWGSNGSGELGDDTYDKKSSPVQTVAGGTNWKQVAVGTWFSAAIKTDGTLWTWGQNNYGQLGNNDQYSEMTSPVQTIAGGTTWKYVSCGARYITAITYGD